VKTNLAALARSIRRRLVAQAGFALPVVIGTSMILGITGTTAMVYSTSNVRTAASSKADERAFALAEAGLNYAYSTLYNASDPTMPGAVPLRSDVVEDGTITWWGTLDTETNKWTLNGRGELPNPAGGMNVIRVVRGRASVQSVTVGSEQNAIWNYIYAEAPTSCTTLSNSVNVNVPIYIKGDLCLQNSAQVSGQYTVLQVGGTLTLNNSSHVGSSGSPLAEVHIAGGCKKGSSGQIHNPCGPADSVYSTLPPDAEITGLEKPAVDLAYWYANSKPGPMQGCTSGSFPGGFDNDTTMNRSRSTVNLTPGTSYDCSVHDGQGNLVGRIAWNPSTKALTIAGTIFFDGDIEFQNSTNAFYTGRATIYSSGKITMQNSTKLCGSPGCNSAWQPTQNLLAFVAGSSTDAIGFQIRNSGIFQGAIYSVNDYSEENSATVWGPIIARQIYLQNSSTNFYVPLGTLLTGMPQTSEEAISIVNESGSWG
jgi:Tfp pilus assembly protein PilX